MYWYKNRRTGTVIETPCPCEGEDWEALGADCCDLRRAAGGGGPYSEDDESRTTEAASAASRRPPARRKARG